MNKQYSFFLSLLICVFSIQAEENPVTLEKIDKKIDQVIVKQDQIYEKVENNPLNKRSFGAEINLFRLLATESSNETLAGGVSYFDHRRNAEIAIPLFYGKQNLTNNSLTLATADVHYRLFLGETLNGFYLSGFSRAAYLKGTLRGTDYLGIFGNTNNEQGAEFKLGIGVGIGYRIFSKSGIYWGTSLSAGRYVIGRDNRFTYSGSFVMEDSKYIFDIELLKFGYAF